MNYDVEREKHILESAMPGALLSGETSGAEFSPCKVWRYALWRHWDCRGYADVCTFIGLNPSTADETANDPTVRRCIDYAQRWGFGGLYMLNLYAYRATDPAVMKAAADPVGPGADEALARFANRSGLVVCAWGAHATPERAAAVLALLEVPTVCLGLNANGSPKHPLYLRRDAERIPFPPECLKGNV